MRSTLSPGPYAWHGYGAPRVEPRSPLLEALISLFALLIPLALLSLSPMGLGALGWNYETTGSSVLERFHPSTYLVLLLTVTLSFRSGNPITGLQEQFARDLKLTIFLGLWIALFLYAIVNQKAPSAPLVDTFFIPLLLLIAVRQLAGATKSKMMWILHIMLTLNALLGVGEFVTGWRLTPFYAAGLQITDDWRSTALLGQPLANALATGCYTMLLLLGGSKELKGTLRTAMIGLQFLGMIVFGGRASLVLLALFACGTLGWSILRFMMGHKIRLLHLTLVATLAPLLVGVIFMLLDIRFFDKFLLRFTADKGSAEARIIMFELFNAFTWDEILLGPPQDLLHYRVVVHQLEFGIESVWISFALSYGILPSVLFFIGVLLFFASLLSDCQGRASVVLIYFMIVNSTFLGLGGKTIILSTLTLMMVLMLPKTPHRPERETGQPASFRDNRNMMPC